jgi:hypothetical protein
LQKLLWRRWATLFDLQVDLRRRDGRGWTQIFLQEDQKVEQRREFWGSSYAAPEDACAVIERRRPSQATKPSDLPIFL